MKNILDKLSGFNIFILKKILLAMFFHVKKNSYKTGGKRAGGPQRQLGFGCVADLFIYNLMYMQQHRQHSSMLGNSVRLGLKK